MHEQCTLLAGVFTMTASRTLMGACLHILLFAAGMFISVPKSHGQLVLNEACSKNVSSLEDGFDHFPDWIELYNAGASSLELGTYFLSDDANELGKWSLPQETLAPGQYLVLFEGNNNSDGHHFNFHLSQDGETVYLSNNAIEVVAVLEIPFLRHDHSYGGWWNSSSAGFVFTIPTPGAANNTTGYLGYASDPQFDHAPGFYQEAQSIAIIGTMGTDLHFTVDGSIPNFTSTSAVTAVAITSTVALKAIAYGDSLVPSNVVVGTYLINEHIDLPVVSLSMDPDSMFNEELGIYMLGPEADTVYPFWGANFWDERGIEVHFEYFDEQGLRGVDQELELRIHGGRASRNKPQRPLRLTARDDLGDDLIRYPFFPERPEVNEFKRLILRNSGADWCLAHYRDGLFHQVSLHNDLNIDELAFKPSVVFINAQYWGIMNIRERIDEDHLAIDYGADRDDLLLMEEENLSIQGDTMHFHDLKEYIHTHDMNDPVHFAYVESLLDIPSFMDYFALEMFAGNADWPSNNLKYWKPSITEGKWRYLMYDMDATMNVFGWIPMDFDMFYWTYVHRAGFVHAEIFRSLMNNAEFKRGYLNRLADLMNTSLSPERFNAESELIKDLIDGEVERHFQRWGIWLETWHYHVDSLIPTFAQLRPDIMRQDILEWYQFANKTSLRFEVFPPNAGRIHINTIEPEIPFTGVYFNGNDIDITAISNEGYRFDHWGIPEEEERRSNSSHVRKSFVNDGTVTAYFQRQGEELVAYPDPWTDELTLSLNSESEGSAVINIIDAQGRSVYTLKRSTSQGINAVRFNAADLSAGMYTIEVLESEKRSVVKAVKMDR